MSAAKSPSKPKTAKSSSTGPGKGGKATPGEIDARLLPKQRVFVAEYLKDKNASAAYRRAYGASAASADTAGPRLLGNVRVRTEIERLDAELLAQIQLDAGITRERVLQEAWNIATADTNELIEYRRLACAECWPGDPDKRRGPNPECGECSGEGHGHVFAKDTRKLSAAARSLYAGVKITKEGFEIKMHSKLDALEKVAKHLGLYKADNDQKQPPLAEAVASLIGALHSEGAAKLALTKR